MRWFWIWVKKAIITGIVVIVFVFSHLFLNFKEIEHNLISTIAITLKTDLVVYCITTSITVDSNFKFKIKLKIVFHFWLLDKSLMIWMNTTSIHSISQVGEQKHRAFDSASGEPYLIECVEIKKLFYQHFSNSWKEKHWIKKIYHLLLPNEIIYIYLIFNSYKVIITIDDF